MRSKFLNIFSLIFNAIIAVGAISGIVIIFVHSKLDAFKFLDTYLLLLAFISCVIGMAYNIKTFSNGKQCASVWYLDLKLTTVSLLIMNLVIAFGFGYNGNVSGTFIIPRLIMPCVLFLNFIFCEIEAKYSYRSILYTPIPLTIYIATIMTLVANGIMKAPNQYLDTANNSWITSMVITLIIVAFAVIVTFLTMQLNRLFHYIIIQTHAHEEKMSTDWMPKEATSDPDEIEEIIAEAKNEETIDDIILTDTGLIQRVEEEEILEDVEEEKVEEEPQKIVIEEVPASEVVIEEPEEEEEIVKDLDKPTDTKTITRVYHISHHRTEPKWQVKLAGSVRAVKLFKTQKEAIDFAKDLVKSQGGSYLIHGVDGKIRKG